MGNFTGKEAKHDEVGGGFPPDALIARQDYEKGLENNFTTQHY